MSEVRSRSTKRAGEFLLLPCMLGLAIVTSGCGSYTSGTSTAPSTAATSKVTTQVKIGDAPAARVISFEVAVGPVSLTDDAGNTSTVLAKAQRIELSHLSGTNLPLSLLKITQGTYKAASLTISNPEVTFINSAGQPQHIEPSFNQNVNIPFSPSLSISGASAVINIDFDVSKSLTFDASGNVTGVNISASSFTVSTAAVAAEDKQGHDDGELEDTTGVVTAVSGSSFNLTVADTGAQLTFATDSKTEFEDGASLASLVVNSIVTVEGATRADGSLYARKVEGLENETGAELEGTITVVAGSPATSLTLVADHGTGSGVDDSKIGASATVNVSGARFEVKTGDIDTKGLGTLPSSEFPFDSASVHAGQRVEIDSHDAMTGTTLSAERVRLQQQALVGIVSGLTGATSSGPATFTLSLPSDAAFSQLSGSTSLQIVWQPSTDLHGLTSVSNGDTIRVRGLVFFNGPAASMIARRIDK
ncbi:DUF5666 domain-containing protein [Occallatibacter savannae]|uniref:DUF5666 domain-containing protein n=1 Tax=Occallatibacter savannae TaxID=1002691 RepID=UPI0013A587FD|nr:DUF5666 domain-containing protein [Occallatibacter savannae]